MTAINFPASPSPGDKWPTTGNIDGKVWAWDGTTWKIVSTNGTVTIIDNTARSFAFTVTYTNVPGSYNVVGTDRNGEVNGLNPTITVNEEDTLIFNVNASGHPFYLVWQHGGSSNQVGGGQGTNTASNQGTVSGTVTWVTDVGDGDALPTGELFYYQCGNHTNMYGTIKVLLKNTSDSASHIHDLIDLDDTPNAYDDGKYLRSTVTGTEWATVTSGTTYDVVDDQADGLAPQLPASHGGKFLKADGSWEVPSYSTGGATTLNALTDVNVASPTDGHVLKYDASAFSGSGGWIAAADQTSTGGTGISLTDLSRTNANPGSQAKLDYNNQTGVFTYTPLNMDPWVKVQDTTSTTISRTGSSYLTVTSDFYIQLSADQYVRLDGNNSVNINSSTGPLSVSVADNITLSGGSFAQFNSTRVDFRDTSNTRYAFFDPSGLNLLTSGIKDKDGNLGTSGQILSSTGTSVDWIDAPGGETNQFAFSKIAVSGQNDVDADAKTDTLTFVADGGMTITTDNSGDTVTFESQDTTYGAPTTSAAGLVPQLPASNQTNQYLRGDGSWQTVSTGSGETNQFAFSKIAVNGQSDVDADQKTDTLTFEGTGAMTITTDNSGDKITFDSTNTTYNDFTGTAAGLVPNGSSAGSSKFLRSDGSWQIPTNTTYNTFAGAGEGLVPDGSSAGSTKFLRSDGSWQTVSTSSGETNQNAFSNISVSGQSTVAADNKTDTVTFVAQGAMSITTNSSSDQITFNSTNTTYGVFSGSSSGLVPNGSSAGNDKFLKSDGTWDNVSSGTTLPTPNVNGAVLVYQNGWEWSRTALIDGGTSSNNTNLVVHANPNGYGGMEITSNGQVLLKKAGTSYREGGHLQFEDHTFSNNDDTFAIDVYSDNGTNSACCIRIIDQETNTQRFSVNHDGAWGIGHTNPDYGSIGEVMISRGSTLPPVWGNHGDITGSAFATTAQGATADTANAEIDHIYSQLNAIGNDDSITTVAQLKTALLALVRN